MDPLSTQEQEYFNSGGEAELPAPESTPESAPAAQPEQTQAPQPEAAPPQQPQEPAKPPEQPRMVDYRALAEERRHNRELREQLSMLQRQMQQFEQRVSGQQQQTPKFDENPAEYLKTKVEAIEQQTQQTVEKQIANERANQFKAWYQQKASEYAQAQPDFMNAYQFYQNARLQELSDAGLPIEQAQARFIQEEAQLAIGGGQVGVNPAHLVYQAAVAKGYKAAPVAPQAPPAPQPQLETIKKGMEASKPMSAVGGGGQTENLTWDWVASVPDKEFLAAWKKMEAAEEAAARRH